jgi:hypothetical protein
MYRILPVRSNIINKERCACVMHRWLVNSLLIKSNFFIQFSMPCTCRSLELSKFHQYNIERGKGANQD